MVPRRNPRYEEKADERVIEFCFCSPHVCAGSPTRAQILYCFLCKVVHHSSCMLALIASPLPASPLFPTPPSSHTYTQNSIQKMCKVSFLCHPAMTQSHQGGKRVPSRACVPAGPTAEGSALVGASLVRT